MEESKPGRPLTFLFRTSIIKKDPYLTNYMNFHFLKRLLGLFVAILIVPTACNEDDDTPDTSARKYTSAVVERWLDVQTSMLYVATGNPFGFNPSRYMAYCGIAVYESILP